MPNCKEFLELTPAEQRVFESKLLHAVRSDEYLFHKAKSIIDIGELKDLYEGVSFNPEPERWDNKLFENECANLVNKTS